MIEANLRSVTQRISMACERSGRRPSDVKLVCVTKQASIDQIRTVISLGVATFGENRVQDAVNKSASIGGSARWHLVGHLQTNKVRDAVRMFDLIHSVDSLRLAMAIDKEASRIGKVQEALVQVNVSGEKSKFGMPPGELEEFIDRTRPCGNFRVKGLMTIAPIHSKPEDYRAIFRSLRRLRDGYGFTSELSMGMTDDFEVAVEEGATLIRIGRAIFG